MPDLEPITLNPLGPHSPEYTRQVAAVRVLNHATGPQHRAAALEFPSDVDVILGHVTAAVAGLPQLLSQLLAWLQDENAAGRVRLDNRGDPGEAVTDVGMDLLEANGFLDQVRTLLDAARQNTARMGAPDAS